MKNTHTEVNPAHYDAKVNGQPIQVVDIIEAFFVDDAHLSQACKYLLRAGKKPGSSYLKDVGKALWWCAKAIMFHGGHVELPPGAIITSAGKVLADKRKKKVTGNRVQ